MEIYEIEDIVGGLMQWEPRTERGHFINLILELWQVADQGNKGILKPSYETIIEKFKLNEAWNKIKEADETAAKASKDYLSKFTEPPNP